MSNSGYYARLPGVVRDHASFFIPYAVFLLLAGAILLGTEQGETLFYFNEHRTQGLNTFFRYATVLGDGVIFAFAFIPLLFLRYRFALLLPVLGVLVSLITQSLKRVFHHPRPYAYFREYEQLDKIIPIEGIEVYTGMNSFPSGHTMTAFALFTYIALCLPQKQWGGFMFFSLALLVGISRVYLIHHFLEDIYLGSILGVFTALACYWLANYIPGRKYPWLDSKLELPRWKKENVGS